MKNLSIFGNFLKSSIFIFLTLGVLSSEVLGFWGGFRVDCDDSLDTATNNVANQSVISVLDGATGDVSTCISGQSADDESEIYKKDYYTFTVATDGILNVTTSSPNNHQFRLEIMNETYSHHYYGTSPGPQHENHPVSPIVLESGDTVVVQVKETGSDLDKYKINFNFVNTDLSENNERDFEVIHTSNAYSKALLIGNVNFCKRRGNSGAVCDSVGALATENNNGIYMINNDYDDTNNISDNNATTINSSGAYLAVPAGKKVLWAGLTWQQHHSATRSANAADLATKMDEIKHVKFKHEDENYTTITSTKTNWYRPGVGMAAVHLYTQGFADVTEYVTKGGFYWVGDIIALEGNHAFAGWSLMVVYEDENEEMRNTTVYNGYKGLGPDMTVETTLSGFLTPQDADNNISSALFIMAGEGDITQNGSVGTEEKAYVTDGSDIEHEVNDPPLNPIGNIFNSTITGSSNSTHKPYYSNALGIDVDSYDVGNLISHGQSSTKIKIVGSIDTVFLGMFALETELYVPELCYDYAYSQNKVALTEKNYAAHDPLLIARDGSRFRTDIPIDVKFYIRNKAKSDAVTSNTKFYLKDINTSAAPYVANTTRITPPSSNKPKWFKYDAPESEDWFDPKDPNAFSPPKGVDYVDANNSKSTHDYQIMNVWNGTIDSEEFFYVYFQLDPQVADINMSLNAEIMYDIKIPDTNDSISMEYPIKLNDKVPICAENPFVYTPQKGIFNITHDFFWSPNTNNMDENLTANNDTRTYNLPTQVVNRNGNFHIIALNPEVDESVDGGFNTLKSIQTVVGVELIDADGWADATTSCTDSDVSVSDILWIPVMSNTHQAFNNAAVTDALTNIGKAGTNFFDRALKKAAFRISYQVVDDNDTMMQFSGSSANSGNFKIDNFPDIAGTTCAGDPTPTNLNDNNQVGQWCGNNGQGNGNNGQGNGNLMTNAQLAECMICLNGLKTKRVCSRDDFAIRPEAFLLEMTDMNQTTGTLATTDYIDDGNSGDATTVDQLAAGYNYNLKVTATTHTDNSGSVGYGRSLSKANYVSDTNSIDELSYNWNSSFTLTTCNDINSTHGAVGDFGIDSGSGTGESNTSMNQVGIYTLTLSDTTWCDTDWDFSRAENSHNDNNGTDNRFRKNGGTAVVDCVQTNSTSQAIASSALNGCDINSTNNNPDNALDFVAQTYQFNPYKFGINQQPIKVGIDSVDASTIQTHILPFGTQSQFVYMADLDKNRTMSVQLMSDVIAQGHNGVTLTNFVDGCYATDINYTVVKSASINTSLTFMSKITDANVTNGVSVDQNSTGTALNASMIFPKSYFHKELNATAKTKLFMNFYRENNVTANPEDINYSSIVVGQNPIVPLKADLVANKNLTSDKNITNGRFIHYYARSGARKARIRCTTASCKSDDGGQPKIFINYEIFCHDVNVTTGNVCNPNLKPKKQASSSVPGSDRRWFINFAHKEATFGKVASDINTMIDIDTSGADVGSVIINGARDNTPANEFQIDAQHDYDESQGLPYGAIMKDVVPSWLNHNDYRPDGEKADDPSVPTTKTYNQHFVKFLPITATWSGAHETNTTTSIKQVERVNRRTQW